MTDEAPFAISALRYLREEGLRWYLTGAGLRFLVLFFVVGKIAECELRRKGASEAATRFCEAVPTATGLMLAIVVTALVFQIGAFSIEEIVGFIESDMARVTFAMLRAGARWSATMAMLWFAVSLGVPVLLPSCRQDWPGASMNLAFVSLGGLFAHLWFSVRTAFDMADVKTKLALEIAKARRKVRETDR